MKSLDILSATDDTLIVEGAPDRRIMKCLVRLSDAPDGGSRHADSASFLNGERLSISFSVSNGCVGRCERVCPSGLPDTLQKPLFTSEEIVRQIDEHVRLRRSAPNIRVIDAGGFADGDAGSNLQALAAARVLLDREEPPMDHLGLSTIGVNHKRFLPAFEELAARYAPGRLRLHYSYYGPLVHDAFIPRPAPPIDEVFPALERIGVMGFPVTLNVPMIDGQTDSDGNMRSIVRHLRDRAAAFRVKLSSFNAGHSVGGESLRPASVERMRFCEDFLRQNGLRTKLFLADTQDDGTMANAGCGRNVLATRAACLQALTDKK